MNEPVLYDEVNVFKLPVDVSISSNLPSIVNVVVATEPLSPPIDDEIELLNVL